MPTLPNTWRLASATQALPGPVILSTGRMVAVPQASAAMAWAPPIRQISLTPAIAAAASTGAATRPPGAGTAIAMRPTPAIRAGTAFISTELG